MRADRQQRSLPRTTTLDVQAQPGTYSTDNTACTPRLFEQEPVRPAARLDETANPLRCLLRVLQVMCVAVCGTLWVGDRPQA